VLETANDVFFFSISIQVPIFLITANNKRRFFLQNQTTKNWADVILESCCPWWSIFPTKFWGREFRKTTRSCLRGLVWPLISILSPNIVEKVLCESISALIDVYIYIYIYIVNLSDKQVRTTVGRLFKNWMLLLDNPCFFHQSPIYRVRDSLTKSFHWK